MEAEAIHKGFYLNDNEGRNKFIDSFAHTIKHPIALAPPLFLFLGNPEFNMSFKVLI